MNHFIFVVRALAACALLLPLQVVAQAWPTKPVRVIVPYPAGGTSDILARTLGQKLSEMWGQPVVAANKPGANGNVGADFVAKAPPDGYTLLLCDVGAGDQPQRVHRTRLRSEQGLRHRHHGRVFAAHPGG